MSDAFTQSRSIAAKYQMFVADPSNFKNLKEEDTDDPFNKIFRAKDRTTKDIVAIHVLKEENSSDESLRFVSELELFIKVKPHVGIEKFFGYYFTPEKSIITEYFPNGSLYNLYRKFTKKRRPEIWTPTFRSKLAFGIAAAMMHIHAHKAVHRFLNPRSIMFDELWEPKIVNFVFAKTDINEEMVSSIPNEIQFRAPEIADKFFDNKVDVYSFAIILFTIVDNGMASLEKSAPKIPAGTPKLTESIITNCMNKDPKKRPSFSQIVRVLLDNEGLFPDTDPVEYDNFKNKYFNDIIIAEKDKNIFKRQPKGTTTPTSSANSAKTSSKETHGEPKKDETNKAASCNATKAAGSRAKSDSPPESDSSSIDDSETGTAHDDDDDDDEREDLNTTISGGKTFDDYLKEATAGNENAMIQVGRMLQKGKNTKKDLTRAAEMFKKVSEKGNPVGLYNFAMCKARGIGKKANMDKARHLMKEAAAPEKKFTVAMRTYADWLEESNEYDEALKYYKHAVDGGDMKANYGYASVLEKTGDVAKALEFYKKAGEAGIPEGANDYAILLLNDESTENKENAIRILEQSAARGYAISNFNLGIIYLNGNHGIAKNEADSTKYFEEAANQNHVGACFYYARALARGIGIEKNIPKAAHFYEKAAQKGNGLAMVNLASILQKGTDGVNEDKKKAADLLKKAADVPIEDPMACFRFGQCLEEGIGIKQDINKALVYYKKAAGKGIPDAQKKVKELKW